MVEQLKTFDSNVLAFTIIDGFSNVDEQFIQKLFNNKIDAGFEQINILVKLDEYKFSKTSAKAFFDDILFGIRNFKKMGRLAIVGDSSILKVLVEFDNLFYKNKEKGRAERYFNISEMDEAMMFVNPE